MKTQEIRTLQRADIEKQIDEAHQELFNLRFQAATGKIKNYKRINEVKKTIARAKTVLREADLTEEAEKS
jgi:large subunit ribosomal protein L29